MRIFFWFLLILIMPLYFGCHTTKTSPIVLEDYDSSLSGNKPASEGIMPSPPLGEVGVHPEYELNVTPPPGIQELRKEKRVIGAMAYDPCKEKTCPPKEPDQETEEDIRKSSLRPR